MLDSEAFTVRVCLLELWVNELTLQRQLRSAQQLRNSVRSFFRLPGHDCAGGTKHISKADADDLAEANILLEESIDRTAFSPGHEDNLVHILAILNHLPLHVIHSATGWKTNDEQMNRSKTVLQNFFQRNRLKARKCMWHAAVIFKNTRNTRRIATYDVFSLTIATTYMYSYIASQEDIIQRRERPESPKSRSQVVRLDQLKGIDAIQHWIESVREDKVHLTGVGILSGPDCCTRLLQDVVKTLNSQISWSSISRVVALSLNQLKEGEKPTTGITDYDEATGTRRK
jgi:hypothetical protein